jgi:uncharacterized membrane protein
MSEQKFNWKKILFVASLAVNVLVVGALAGAAFKHKDNDRSGGGSSTTLQGAMIRALPMEQRKMLGQKIRGDGNQFKKQRGQSREVKDALKNAIASVPFDADALRAVFERQKQVRDVFTERGDALWIELITNMSDEERAAFAKEINFRKSRKPSKPRK